MHTELLDVADEDDWFDTAEKHAAQGAVVLVDAPMTAEVDQGIHDAGLVQPATGALVRFWVTDTEALHRAQELGRTNVDRMLLDRWRTRIPRIDERARILSLPYYMIPNERSGLDAAVAELARKAGVTY